MSSIASSPTSSSFHFISNDYSFLENVDICPVCLCAADHAHFGGIKSCNSCAAFFRRTIVAKKSYRCRANQNCILKKDKHQRGCQSCRFKKCLQIGMAADAVRSRAPLPVTENDGSLTFLLKSRRSNFTVRARATLNVYGGAESYVNMSNQPKTGFTCKQALIAEEIVLSQYIQTLNITDDFEFLILKHIIELEAYFKYRNFKRELTHTFMSTWIGSEALFSTVRHRGFRSKRVYFIDDSYLKFDEDYCVEYYRGYQCFIDPYLVATSGFKLYTSVIQYSERIYQSRISESEYSAIQLVLLLQTAIRLRPTNVELKKRLNQLFIALQRHMNENFENIALRMDEFMLNLERVQDVKRVRDEAYVMQYIQHLLNRNQH
ncbi:Nuclear receptor domain-containing protein [Aphelenchoides bicaudatus]|nr:Nuclear receptor domain-containing protein [Aphelenchoides bicaudatus]